MSEQESLHPLRPFLKNWLWEHGRVGTRHLDCATGEIRFDEGKKARFAAEVQRAVQDCIDLGLACACQPDAQRAGAHYALEPMFDDEIRAAVVADIRRKYLGTRAQLALYDFTVFHGLPDPLLLGDTPFIDWRVRARPPLPFVSMPLGPYCLLVGTPSNKTSRAGPVSWKSVVAMGPFKDHNHHIVEAARLWLVATTDEQLAALQARYAPREAPKAEKGGG